MVGKWWLLRAAGHGEPGQAAEGNGAAGKVLLTRPPQKKWAKITPVSPISSCPRIPQSGEDRAAGRAAGRLAGPGQPPGRPLGRLLFRPAGRCPAAAAPPARWRAARPCQSLWRPMSATMAVHLNRGPAARPAPWPPGPAPGRAPATSTGRSQFEPGRPLAGACQPRAASRPAGPIFGEASPDFHTGRPGGWPDLAAGQPVRQGGRPLTR